LETIKQLILKRLRKPLSLAEEKKLQDWMMESAQNEAIVKDINDPEQLAESFAKLDSLHPELVWDRVKSFSNEHKENTIEKLAAVHRLHKLKTVWFRVAAAVVVMLGTSTFFWVQYQKSIPVSVVNMSIAEDVPAPSSSRAMIELSNGQHIFLDSANNGTIATQGNVNISKRSDNRIVYTGKGEPGKIEFNTFTVPRGSQIASIVLTDGSTVFMNSGSSITYPVAFRGNERKIEITGEAYFEVAKDPSRKFIVSGGGMTTEVIGTHFNVNTYQDEVAMEVTLLEGSVKVSDGSSDKIIRPGEQATFTRGVMGVNHSVDVDQVMSWKNGLFNFQDKHLPEVMRQLARWYDLQVVYENKIPDIEFFGQMGRNLKLSDVLEVLKSAGVHFRIKEGRHLIVM
jgi:transmembrane sensor